MDVRQTIQRFQDWLLLRRLNKKEICFLNGNRAHLLAAPDYTPAEHILKTLDIKQPKALFLIVGGAAGLDESLKPLLVRLFGRGIARAAVDTGALIIDGGTQAGVMELIGQGVADHGRRSILLGVAPAGRVTYPDGPTEESVVDGVPLDPNHSHFVLVEGDEWGGETETMFDLADALSRGIPVVTVLVSGGDISKKEVLSSVRHGWHIIVIEGTGRLADEIATLKKQKLPLPDDPAMAEIIADGDIHLFSLDGAIDDLKSLINSFSSFDPTLKLAWERFSLYDANAIRQQTSFNRLQIGILLLGVLATFLALAYTQGVLESHPWGNTALKHVILILPITISILVAAANRFKAGNKWVFLRAGAEAIKREIYRYRTCAGIYSDQQTDGQEAAEASRKTKLACNMEAISHQLMQTEVNLSALRPYGGRIPPPMYGAAAADDGYSVLTPDRYLTIRLGDQLNYYQLKTTKLERRLKRLQWSIYICGGAGTFLAAVGLHLWIALTVTIVGAVTTLLEYEQAENTLMKYNHAATDLSNIQAWWTALSSSEKTDQENIDKLVGNTEKTLQSELTGWVQRMEDTLAELHKQQSGR